MAIKLPAAYKWLLDEPGPLMLQEGLNTYGTKETPGRKSTQAIMAWVAELEGGGTPAGRQIAQLFKDDSIPWCGLWMAVIAARTAKDVPPSPLWARAWAAWGTPSPSPTGELGDVLVFVRQGGGHVGLYVGEDETHYHVLGGNQSDSVSFTRIAKSRLIAARRSYKKTPKNVRKVTLAKTGTPVSTDEA